MLGKELPCTNQTVLTLQSEMAYLERDLDTAKSKCKVLEANLAKLEQENAQLKAQVTGRDIALRKAAAIAQSNGLPVLYDLCRSAAS